MLFTNPARQQSYTVSFRDGKSLSHVCVCIANPFSVICASVCYQYSQCLVLVEL